MLNYKVNIVRPYVTVRGPSVVINSVCMSTYEDAADISYDNNFVHVLQSNVKIYHVNIPVFGKGFSVNLLPLP